MDKYIPLHFLMEMLKSKYSTKEKKKELIKEQLKYHQKMMEFLEKAQKLFE